MTAPAIHTRLQRRSVSASLAARDAWRLARHPFVLAGLGFGVLMIVGAGHRVNSGFELLLGYALMPLAIGTAIAAQLLASRSRRNGTEELEATTAATGFHRTVAALGALVGPLTLGVLFLVFAFIWLGASNGVPVALADGIRQVTMHPAELGQGLAGVAFFGAVGAALGAWIPSRFVPPVMLAALLFVFTVLGWSAQGWVRWALPMTHHETQSLEWVQVTPGYGYGIVAGYDRVAMTWHVAYVLAFSVVAGMLALLRYRRDRAMIAGVLVMGVVTAVLSVVQVP